MKKITFICQQLKSGGAERVISILIKYLFEHDYDVQLILLFDNQIDYPIPSGVSVTNMNWKKGMKIKGLYSRISDLRKAIRGECVISVLFVAIFYTILATRFSKIKVVVSERNDPHNDPPGALRKLIRTLLYCMADNIIFQTEEAKKFFPAIIQRKGFVISNPIKEEIGLVYQGTRRKCVVSICRLNEQKNLKMAIDAFSIFFESFPDYIYEIYGDGDLKDELKDYINSINFGNRIFLKGFSKNVHDEVKDAMMFISSSDYEGISNSMLEAMALGLPVICTDCPIGGARQTIDNGKNGILIPTRDTMALVKAMKDVASNEEYRLSLSHNACKVRQEYNAEKICSMWEETING